ncbi:CDP-diacylglycerol--serine O-phosphatidyltransferase [Desulfococcaceae bacterium OttesenSCG-928-F15]|nr:CDP-diacylglycerol--serine O-phosphatidyltransferase [Desulfococcaceae bacterium OttesenSCG-928-F15]
MKKRRYIARSRKGVYVLPNLFTSMNLFCGFYSIVSSINGKMEHAAVAIFVAILFDIMDGKVARLTHTTSRFGIEYDSLADLVSFGLAPSLMIYLWALVPMGRLGWLAAFLFTVCGALRLARFNSMVDEGATDFTGLPIPGAAAMTATTLLLCTRTSVSFENYPLIPMIMLYALSFLMVSNIRYYSFKKYSVFKKFSFNVLVACILVLIFIASEPPIALFIIAFLYTLSGPLGVLWRIRKRTSAEETSSEAETPEEENTPKPLE